MAAIIKTSEEIEKMRFAGQQAADVLTMIEPFIQVGITTNELNQRCHDFIVNEQGGIPAPLNYHGFPKSICTSLNYVVCHGIPNDKALKDGDIINVDITVIKDGYHGDTSKMFMVGKTSILAARLSRIAQECLYIGINMVKPGERFCNIGAAIQKHAENHNYSVVREYCGHGIGAVFHEEPQVLHYGQKYKGNPEKNLEDVLKIGQCFTIEPMINAGKRACKVLKDEWTVITKDKKLSAQWEHTLLVTETGVEILTLRPEETIQRNIHHD